MKAISLAGGLGTRLAEEMGGVQNRWSIPAADRLA